MRLHPHVVGPRRRIHRHGKGSHAGLDSPAGERLAIAEPVHGDMAGRIPAVDDDVVDPAWEYLHHPIGKLAGRLLQRKAQPQDIVRFTLEMPCISSYKLDALAAGKNVFDGSISGFVAEDFDLSHQWHRVAHPLVLAKNESLGAE